MKLFVRDKLSKTSILVTSLCCAVLAVLPGGQTKLSGQEFPGMTRREQPGQESVHAAEELEKIAVTILTEYVMTVQPLTSLDVQAIGGQLKALKKYTGRLDLQDRAYQPLIEAYMAFYSQDKNTALKKIRTAMRYAPDNTDISDSGILMALYWEDYKTAKQFLAKRNAGLEAVKNAIASWRENQLSEFAGQNQPDTSNDPAEPNDLSSLNPSTLASKQTSKWDVNLPDSSKKGRQSNARGKEKNKSKGKGKKGKGSSRSRGGRGPTLGVGMGLGAIAPVDPMYLQQIGDESSSSRTKTAKKQTVRYKPRRGSTAGSILNLMVDYMPYVDLGEDFQKVQLRNVNGSYFYYEPGRGQVLCALLWSLPNQDGSTRSPTRRGRRQVFSSEDIMRSSALMMSGKGRSKPGQKTGRAIPEPSEELWTNADQFRDMFGMYALQGHITGTSGIIAFTGINLNQFNSSTITRVGSVLMERPWPWSTCMFDEAANRSQLNQLSAASPVMMIVGADGRICYTGPVGGFLPLMILQREMGKIVTSATASAALAPTMTPANPPAEQAKSGLLGLLFGADKSPEQPSPEEPQNKSTEQPQQSAQPKVELPQQKKSDHQAFQMLQQAYVQKKILTNKALQTCDEILKRWPDSLEAEQAKEVIKSILRNRKSLKHDREKQGKYTG